MSPRSRQWQKIWELKGGRGSSPLHTINGYDVLEASDWHHMILELSVLLGALDGARLVELGCGAGAFLGTLHTINSSLALTGIDYAQPLIDIAKRRLKGTFLVGDVRGCPALESAHFDIACSFGVTMYLDSLRDVQQMMDELCRVVHPDGVVFVGEVSNEALRAEATALRRISHGNQDRVVPTTPDHLYINKHFFVEYAERRGMILQIHDHSEFEFASVNPMAAYRYSLTLRHPGSQGPSTDSAACS